MQRVFWGLVMAAGAIVGALLGGWVFAIALALVTLQVAREWTTLSLWREGVYIAAVATPSIVAVLLTAAVDPLIPVAIVSVGALVVGLWLRSGWLAGGVVYASALGIGLVALRIDDSLGLAAVAFVFAVVWATDSAAFFAGRAIGGPKLWPAVSPKKTWSGAIGGTVAAILAAIVVALIADVGVTLPLMLVAFALSIAAQIGDLFESGVKRHFGTKDAGALIPGHGGAMDRVDGLIFAAALAAAIGALRGDWPNLGAGLLVW